MTNIGPYMEHTHIYIYIYIIIILIIIIVIVIIIIIIYIHHKSYEPVVGCCGHIWLVKSYEIIWNHVNLHFRSFVIQLHADPLTARKPGRLLQQNILQGTSFPQTGARDHRRGDI